MLKLKYLFYLKDTHKWTFFTEKIIWNIISLLFNQEKISCGATKKKPFLRIHKLNEIPQLYPSNWAWICENVLKQSI